MPRCALVRPLVSCGCLSVLDIAVARGLQGKDPKRDDPADRRSACSGGGGHGRAAASPTPARRCHRARTAACAARRLRGLARAAPPVHSRVHRGLLQTDLRHRLPDRPSDSTLHMQKPLDKPPPVERTSPETRRPTPRGHRLRPPTHTQRNAGGPGRGSPHAREPRATPHTHTRSASDSRARTQSLITQRPLHHGKSAPSRAHLQRTRRGGQRGAARRDRAALFHALRLVVLAGRLGLLADLAPLEELADLVARERLVREQPLG